MENKVGKTATSMTPGDRFKNVNSLTDATQAPRRAFLLGMSVRPKALSKAEGTQPGVRCWSRSWGPTTYIPHDEELYKLPEQTNHKTELAKVAIVCILPWDKLPTLWDFLFQNQPISKSPSLSTVSQCKCRSQRRACKNLFFPFTLWAAEQEQYQAASTFIH